MNYGQSIRLDSVAVSFGKVRALDDIHLEFEGGACHGLIGPNGAGKSTLLRAILGLVAMRGGIAVNGVEPADGCSHWRQVSAGIGFAPQSPELYPHLSLVENLRFLGQLRRIGPPLDSRIEVWMNRLGIARDRNRLASALSQGVRKKVCLAAAVLHAPSILLLDEPTEGLDARGVHTVFGMVRELTRRGGLCLLATHSYDTLRMTCDRVVVLDQGQVVCDDSFEEVRDWLIARRLGCAGKEPETESPAPESNGGLPPVHGNTDEAS